MSVRLNRSALFGAAVLVTAAVTLVPWSAAHAAPSGVVVTPLTAGDGDPVVVSGAGCAGAADVTLAVPDAAGTGTEVADQESVTPAGDGSWTATLTMQGSAAVVLASCDGADSEPVVVGDGSSGTRPGRRLRPRRPARARWSSTGWTPGSTCEAGDRPDGTVVGETEAPPGRGRRVTVPGPDNELLVVLGLAGRRARVRARADARSRSTIVGRAAGQPLRVHGDVVSGTEGAGARAPGTVDLEIRSESEDWYDPPELWRITDLVADVDGSWQTSFTLPAEAVLASAGCTLDGGGPALRRARRRRRVGCAVRRARGGAGRRRRRWARRSSRARRSPSTAGRSRSSSSPLRRSAASTTRRTGSSCSTTSCSGRERRPAVVLDSPGRGSSTSLGPALDAACADRPCRGTGTRRLPSWRHRLGRVRPDQPRPRAAGRGLRVRRGVPSRVWPTEPVTPGRRGRRVSRSGPRTRAGAAHTIDGVRRARRCASRDEEAGR